MKTLPTYRSSLLVCRLPFSMGLALLSCGLILLFSGLAQAGNATWKLNPGSGDWNTAANWMPMTVPNGSADTATFGLSSATNVSILANTEVDGITFTPSASTYTITASQKITLTVSGVGMVNNSGVIQNFRVAGGSPGLQATIRFINNANAGSLVHFTNEGGASYPEGGGRMLFYDTSSAGSAAFTDEAATNGGFGSLVIFFNSSTAANGTFTNNGSSSGGAVGGQIAFTDNATAANGTFVNNPGLATSSCCVNAGITDFSGSATAANGTFVNNGAAVDGVRGGMTSFVSNSTAGNAFITNQGGQVSGALGGNTSFSGALSTATAGNATIINNGAAANGALGGTTTFFGFFRNSRFFGNSTAGNATIIDNGATINGAAGGQTIFTTEVVTGAEVGRVTAGNATLVANSGTNGGQGGGIFFEGLSTGGTSRIKVFGNGFLDLSEHDGPHGVSIGSIEGNGNVFLGANNLTVGSSNIGTTFSGVIQDGGQNGGTGGSLTKIGTGTLDLKGTNTYTGNTNINRGVLKVDGSITSNTFVNHGGTLAGTGTIQADVTNNGVVSPGDAPGTLTINGTYTNHGTLLIDIAGASLGHFSVVNVLGTANLSGQLNPMLENGFVPTIGESFTFLNYTSLTGSLNIFDRNIDNGAEHWVVSYQPTAAVLTVAPGNVPLPDAESTLLLLTLSLLGLGATAIKCQTIR